MLVPIIGPFWTAIVTLVFIVAALTLVAAFCWWLDKPRRELVKEIKKRPPIIVRIS